MRVLTAVLVAALLPCSASAAVISWIATGTLTDVDTSNGNIIEYPGAIIGTEFSVTVTYESTSATTQINTEADFGGGVYRGTRYRYGNALLSTDVVIGGVQLERPRIAGRDIFDIYDDFGVSGPGVECFGSVATICDGLAISRTVEPSQIGGFASFALILRGPENLDIFSGPGLPEFPPPELLSLSTNVFQFSDGDDFLIGTISNLMPQGTSSVPEPATWALLGLGLAGLGLNMKRRHVKS